MDRDTTGPVSTYAETSHDSKVHGANMGPIWGRQDPGGTLIGPMNLTIWDISTQAHLAVST